MKLAGLPWAFALLSAGMLVAAGFGARSGLWDYRVGFQLIRWSVYTGLATAAVALVGLLIPRMREGRILALVAVLTIGLAVAYFPWDWMKDVRGVPAINDISTDTDNPPPLVALLPLRAGGSVPATYPGAETAAKQRRAYPEIRPLELEVPPAAAFTRALDAAKGMGWRIEAADAAAGRIEATATTPWFGFRDDVVVRVTPTPTGSRIDVRSVSRVGRSDLGTNAKRIRAYLARLGNA